jgi:predicted phosphodiesterase
MSAIVKWHPEEEHLLRLLLPTNTAREIMEQINRRHSQGLPGFPTERSEKAVQVRVGYERSRPEGAAPYKIDNPYTIRAEQIKKIQAIYEEASEDYPVGRPASTSRKILSLSDIHFPLARMDFLLDAIEDHKDADICVLNGDIFEGHMFSTFEKHKRIAAIDEYRAAFEFVSLCSEVFPVVYLVDGNHDVRTAKALARNGFETEASQIFRPNLMARLANGEFLDETGLVLEQAKFDNVIYDQRESWYLRIGRTLFAHPHGRGNGKPGGTVQTVANYFNSRYQAGAIDSVVIGHTHKFYKGVHQGQLLIEQGCMSGLMSYAHSPKMDFFGGAVNGYAVIYQDEEGNCDFNKSGPIFQGYVMPPKKSVV